jgi:hypothetical protein
MVRETIIIIGCHSEERCDEESAFKISRRCQNSGWRKADPSHPLRMTGLSPVAWRSWREEEDIRITAISRKDRKGRQGKTAESTFLCGLRALGARNPSSWGEKKTIG